MVKPFSMRMVLLAALCVAILAGGVKPLVQGVCASDIDVSALLEEPSTGDDDLAVLVEMPRAQLLQVQAFFLSCAKEALLFSPLYILPDHTGPPLA